METINIPPVSPAPMPQPSNRVLGFLRWHGPTALVLLLLTALGVWGVATDWKADPFSSFWASPEEHEEPASITVSPEPEDGAEGCARTFDRRRLRFPSEEAVTRSGLRTGQAAVRDLAEYITANGAIDYNQSRIAHLSTRVPGIANKILKHIGQTVKKGDALALVESADVGKAKADFLQYLVLVDIKKKIYERLKPSVVPERKIQEAEADLREARIRLYNAQQTLINLGLPVPAEALADQPEDKLAERVRLLGIEDLSSAALPPGQTSSNLIPLRAPFDGVVIGRDIVEGEIVRPQQVQYTVADIDTMWIMLDVRLEDTVRSEGTPALALGQPARFTPDGVPDLEVAGKVDWISTDVDEKTRTVRARIKVDNPGGRLRARTFGTGHIRTRFVTDVVAVPEEAVQEEVKRAHPNAAEGDSPAAGAAARAAKCQMVFVRLSATEFESRLIATGIREAGWVQVQGGIAPRDVVVTTGSHALKSEILKGRIGSGE